jgi:hypothetical protein
MTTLNQDHAEILRESSEAWNKWRQENPGATPNLSASNLIEANLPVANLSNADLSKADMNGICLRAANLARANLRDADLSGGDLSGADLNSADLCGADLRAARLEGSCLRSANLERADLRGARLTGADLQGVNMTRATMGSTVFGANDFSLVKGLDSVQFDGPCVVGIDTVYRSKGRVPESFLRGCGVPETFVAQIPSLLHTAFEYHSCFISYSTKDRPFARRLYDGLQRRGIRCWFAEHALLPGQDIYAEVDKAIRLQGKILLCASKHSLKSWWVDTEVTIAMERERSLWEDQATKVLVLIPLDLDGFLFSGEWGSGVAAAIRKRLAADFRGWRKNVPKFEGELDRLVVALRIEAPVSNRAKVLDVLSKAPNPLKTSEIASLAGLSKVATIETLTELVGQQMVERVEMNQGRRYRLRPGAV